MCLAIPGKVTVRKSERGPKPNGGHVLRRTASAHLLLCRQPASISDNERPFPPAV